MFIHWQKGKPTKSGEYLVILETEAGRKLDIVNYGVTDAFPVADWYYVGTEGPVILDNVIRWTDVPTDLEDI